MNKNDVNKTEIEITSAQTLNPNHKQILKNNPFESKKLFLVILRFVLPAILVTFFQSLYVFADQIMMIKFVPQSDLNPNSIFNNDVFGTDIYANYVAAIGADKALNISDLIRAAVSISAPITVVLNAITLLISMGVSISFGKALGRNNLKEVEQVWSTGFMSNLVIGLATSLFILGISPVWLSQSAIGGSGNTGGSTDPAIAAFSQVFQKLQIQYAQNYVYVICGFNILQVFVQMYYLLSQSEGRQLFISIVPTLANVLNVVLDYILIRYTDLGLTASGFATAIGWGFNFGAYFIYSMVLARQNKTNLVLSKLRFTLFTWRYFYIILFIGLASFLRNTSLALSNALFQTYLVSVTNGTHVDVPAENYYQSIYGSVTPISNLALQSVWGVIQGGRAVASYKYGRKDYESIKKIYWYIAGISLSYGVVIYFIFSFAIADPVLINLFNVTPAHLAEAVFILKITMLQAIFIALGTNAQLYFQSTQRITLSWVSSLMQGVITFIPLLFIMQAAAIARGGADGMNIFIWLQTANAIAAGVINIAIGTIHMYKFMGKREKLIENGTKKANHWMPK